MSLFIHFTNSRFKLIYSFHRIALIVLLNVGRHDHLASSLAACSDSTDALIDLLQMFRDKKALFILAAELLTRLVNSSTTVKAACNQPVYRKRLEGILHIIERKQRLESRVRSLGETQRLAAMHGMGSPRTGEFDRYRGKAYHSIEPINCIEHLMELLD